MKKYTWLATYRHFLSEGQPISVEFHSDYKHENQAIQQFLNEGNYIKKESDLISFELITGYKKGDKVECAECGLGYECKRDIEYFLCPICNLEMVVFNQ